MKKLVIAIIVIAIIAVIAVFLMFSLKNNTPLKNEQTNTNNAPASNTETPEVKS